MTAVERTPYWLPSITVSSHNFIRSSGKTTYHCALKAVEMVKGAYAFLAKTKQFLLNELILPEKESLVTDRFFQRHASKLNTIVNKLQKKEASPDNLLTRDECLLSLLAIAFWTKTVIIEEKAVCEEICRFRAFLKAKGYIKKGCCDKDAASKFVQSINTHISILRKTDPNEEELGYCFYLINTDFLHKRILLPHTGQLPDLNKEGTKLFFLLCTRVKELHARSLYKKGIQNQIINTIADNFFNAAFVNTLETFKALNEWNYVKTEEKLLTWSQLSTHAEIFKHQAAKYCLQLSKSIRHIQTNFKNLEEVLDRIDKQTLQVEDNRALEDMMRLLMKLKIDPTLLNQATPASKSTLLFRIFSQMPTFLCREISWAVHWHIDSLKLFESKSERFYLLRQEQQSLKKIKQWTSDDWILYFSILKAAFKLPQMETRYLKTSTHPLVKELYEWKNQYNIDRFGPRRNKWLYGSLSDTFQDFLSRSPSAILNKLERLSIQKKEKLTLDEYYFLENHITVIRETTLPLKDAFHHWFALRDAIANNHHGESQIIGGAIVTRPLIILEGKSFLRPFWKAKLYKWLMPAVSSRVQKFGHLNFAWRHEENYWAAGAVMGTCSYNSKISGVIKPERQRYTIHPEKLMNYTMQKKVRKKEFTQKYFESLKTVLEVYRKFGKDGVFPMAKRILFSHHAPKPIRPSSVAFTPDRTSMCSQYVATCVILAAAETYQYFKIKMPKTLSIFGFDKYENIYNATPDRVMQAFLRCKFYQPLPGWEEVLDL